MRKASIVLITLLLLLPPLYTVYGYDEGAVGPAELRLIEPAVELMSGGLWLRLKGGEEFLLTGVRAASASPSQAPPIQIPFRSPSPKFSRNLIVTTDIGRIPYQNEPHIAVNPRDSDNVIMASHDYDTFCTVIYASIDGGETWEGPIPSKPLQRDDFCSDPILGFDRQGTAYHGFLSIGSRLANLGRIIAVVDELRIAVIKSGDGGFTWTEPTLAAWGDIRIFSDRVEIISPDKPWMAVGPSRLNPDSDAIYITYTEFKVSYPFMADFPFLGVPTVSVTIKMVKSEDGGETWSKPIAVSPTFSYVAGEIGHEGRSYGRIVQGSYVAVAPDGRVYVAYYDSLSDGPFRGQFAVMITWSDDGGETWETPVRVTIMDELDYYLRPTIFRAWSSMFPQLAISPDGQNIYIAFAANPPGPDDSDIYFVKSTDRGLTWSTPKRVNDDLSDRDQFFPAMAVDPEGVIHIMWGDRRDDPKDIRYHIYYTFSNDTGESFIENGRVSDYPSNPSLGIPIFIGDYFAMAAGENDVYLVWTDSRTGQRGSPNQDIAFARRRPIPLPTIFIDPPEGPAGEGITLTGSGFARGERLVLIEVDGVNVGFTFTDQDGEFITKIFAPFSGEGPRRIRVIDVLGNVAEATFYTSFGFDSLKRTIEGLTEPREPQPTISLEDVRKVVDEAVGGVVSEIKPEISRLSDEIDSVNVSIGNLYLMVAVSIALAVASLAVSVWGRRR